MTSLNLVLSVQDPSAQNALHTGWLLAKDGSKAQVVARQVVDTAQGRHVVFERLPDVARPLFVNLWMQTTRAFSLTATVTPCLVVFAMKLVDRSRIDLFLSLTAMLGVLALQIAINIFNDIEDYRRLIDLPGALGGSGVILKGWWAPSQLSWIARSALFTGMILGLPAVLKYPQSLLLISGAAFLGVLRYSARVFGLKYWALGDLAVWILCGPALTAGFAIAATGHWGLSEIFIGSFFGWMAVAILHANNLQDIHIDKKRGVKTLAIVLGFKNSVRFLALSYLFAAVSLLATGKNAGTILPFVPAILVLSMVATPWLARIRLALGPDSSALINCRVKAAEIHLMAGMALFVSVLIYSAIR